MLSDQELDALSWQIEEPAHKNAVSPLEREQRRSLEREQRLSRDQNVDAVRREAESRARFKKMIIDTQYRLSTFDREPAIRRVRIGQFILFWKSPVGAWRLSDSERKSLSRIKAIRRYQNNKGKKKHRLIFSPFFYEGDPRPKWVVRLIQMLRRVR